jgi:hypothetical protein
MLATLGGTLALAAGLAVLLIPLLVPELSRPRDAFWGAVVLLLGLVLVTSADRLSGAPMLAVLCGGLLIGRLGTEVGQSRWRQLSEEEQLRFWSPQRWQESLGQLAIAAAKLVSVALAGAGGLTGWLKERFAARQKITTKRWVRPEPPGSEPDSSEPPEATPSAAVEVTSFAEIDELLQEAMGAAAEAKTEPIAEATAEPEAEAQTEPEAHPQPEADPEPEAEAQPDTEPEPEPQAPPPPA